MGRCAEAESKGIEGDQCRRPPIDVAAAKVRTGPPLDDDEDYALPIWAGVLPLSLQAGSAIPDPRLDGDITAPTYVRKYRRPGR
jgi:hypothetical protein